MEAYEKMIERLKAEHDKVVSQNKKLRGLELAMEQIHSVGDISTEYPIEVLKEVYELLKKANDKAHIELSERRKFVKEYEQDMGIESDKVKEIFGW